VIVVHDILNMLRDFKLATETWRGRAPASRCKKPDRPEAALDCSFRPFALGAFVIGLVVAGFAKRSKY